MQSLKYAQLTSQSSNMDTGSRVPVIKREQSTNLTGKILSLFLEPYPVWSSYVSFISSLGKWQ